METEDSSKLWVQGARRRRVVLRASGRRHQLEVSDGSETCDSASESENLPLDMRAHYDTSLWHSLPRHRDHKGESSLEYEPLLDDGVSRDVFQEKLELSGTLLHSTPAHPQRNVACIHHPMQPHSVSSAIFREHPSASSSSSDLEENDDVFLDRPKTAPVGVQIHPESSVRVHPNSKAFNKTLSPHPKSSLRPNTSPVRISTDSDPFTSPVHSKAKGKLIHKNRIHPAKELKSFSPSSSAHSANMRGTSSPESQLLSTSSFNSTLSSTLAPLLTTSLRKGGTRPSVDMQWEFDGERQLEGFFPDRHVRVFAGTWNMHEEKELPESLDDFLLPLSHNLAADVYVIGTQESTSSRREWEILVQQTLGPSHVLVHSSSLGVLCLLLFLRRDLLWFSSAVRSSSCATRPVSQIKTKGGVGLSFSLFGSSFLFITSHFTAHQQRVSDRNADMQKIATNLVLSSDSGDKVVTEQFDHVFWLGDLNYRVEMERDKADEHLASADWMTLLLQDQLTKEVLAGSVFKGFSEQPIAFPPTYKFDLHSDCYDSSEKRRIPSWTDRILFKSWAGCGITGCGYDSCRSLKCSDHRPVYAVFQVKLDPIDDIDGIPDTVVSFDREVYLRAHQQRKLIARLSASMRGVEEEPDGPAHQTHRSPSSRHITSTVCTVL